MKGDEYGLAADIFSFAMIMYETMTGLLPYQQFTSGFHITEALLKGERPIIPSHISQKIPPNFLNLIQSCWLQEPENRPSILFVSHLLASFKKELKL